MLYAVPYIEHRLRSGRLVGLDAYFWPSLEARYRVVLLVQPRRHLVEEPPPEACRLPQRTEPDRMAAELRRIAGMTVPPPRAPRPSLLRRLAELVMPPRLLALGEEGEARVPEEAQARGLARIIGDVEPTGRTLWGLFVEEEGGVILPRVEAMARIYAELWRRDAGYRAAAVEARRLCGRARSRG
jgi:hypothetical protein